MMTFNVGLGGIVVRRRAQDPRVVGSKPGPAKFEESIHGQGVNTNCTPLHPEVQMGMWSVVMNAICGCTLPYAVKQSRLNNLWLDIRP